MGLIIDKEFQNLIPPQSEEEHAGLEAMIIGEGCREPLTVWNGIIVDGHNRYEICTRLDLPYKTVEKTFADRREVRIWIRKNQLSRRNLTDAWKLELALDNKADLIEVGKEKIAEAQFERREKEQAGSLSLSVNDKDTKADVDWPEQPEPKHNTRNEIANTAGMSTGKVAQGEYVKKNAPEVWEKAKSGELSIGGAYKEVKEAEQAKAVENGDIPAKVTANTHVANNSGNNEWYTPPEFIEVAHKVMGCIDTDPASSEIANQTVKAITFYTEEDNGLGRKWLGKVWMNPPYAQPLIFQFCNALVEKFECEEIEEAMALVNNATETAWFQRLLDQASAVCFIKSRIKFLDMDGKPTGAPLQGQALLYFGSNINGFTAESEKLGRVLYP